MKKHYKIIVILSILALAYVNQFVIKGESLPPLPNKDKISPAVASNSSKETTGKALIGGAFELTNQNGEKFSSNNLKGKTSLIYFGFSHCPMVCPTALSKITLVMNEIDPEGKKYNYIFITTDPERDSSERLKEYLANFNPAIIGLTGTKEELEEAYKGYKVYAKKVITDNGNYDMNHSSLIYIMDKNGEYAAHFSHESKVEDIVAKLKSLK